MKPTYTDQLGGYVYQRSAPPDWLVPISAEGHAHIVAEHLRACGLDVPGFPRYSCPCEPPRLLYTTCPACGDIVFAVAHESCGHLESFARFGVQIRWWPW
jgi:hypothetical protein